MDKNKRFPKLWSNKIWLILFIPLVLMTLSLLFKDSLYGVFGEENYLMLHLMMELFSIMVSFTIAIHAWMIFPHTLSTHRLWLGSLFLSVGLLDLLHTLSYKGMPFFFVSSSVEYATWFWIVARLTVALLLLLIFLLPNKKTSAKSRYTFYSLSIVYTIFVAFIIIFNTDKLPRLVIEGQGTTLLKNNLEYVVVALHVLTVYVFMRKPFKVPNLMMIVSLFYLIIAEFMFTQYITVYDIQNFIGHLFKIVGFYYVLRSLYVTSVEEPFNIQKSTEEIMKHMAYHDDLTQLPNLRFFKEKVSTMITEQRNELKSVMMMNIDQFSSINESLGYSMGDKLLNLVASRLRSSLPDAIFIARMSTDHFVLSIPHVFDENKVCKTIFNAFLEPIQTEHLDITIHVRLGIAVYSDETNDIDKLIQGAHTAMNEAKKNSADSVYYIPEMKEKSYDRLVLLSDLHKALDNNEFYLVYQPQVDAQTGRIVAMEALLRWKHPIRGIIPPNQFIAALEETGLIIPVGEWIIRSACRQLSKWQEDGLPPLCMAVNLSVRQFYQANLVEIVSEALKQYNIKPSLLELEITESMTMNIGHAKDMIHRLKEIGVKISIDDFGTGYSSLSYLKELSIDRLKIDQSFIRGLATNENDEMIVTTIISITKHLKIEAVAEGVESLEHLQFLKSNQCSHLQGYLLSRPLDPEVISKQFFNIQLEAEKYTRLDTSEMSISS